MNYDLKKIASQFEFVFPADRVEAIARSFIESSDARRQLLANAVLDISKYARLVQAAFSGTPNLGNVDLKLYLDYKTESAVAIANELLNSPDKDERDVSQILLSQDRAIRESKRRVLDSINGPDIRTLCN
jgi:hypothetical protein